MSARPWRKRRNMTPRRWRKYVERGALLRPYIFVFPSEGPAVDVTPTVMLPLDGNPDFLPVAIGGFTHAIIWRSK